MSSQGSLREEEQVGVLKNTIIGLNPRLGRPVGVFRGIRPRNVILPHPDTVIGITRATSTPFIGLFRGAEASVKAKDFGVEERTAIESSVALSEYVTPKLLIDAALGLLADPVELPVRRPGRYNFSQGGTVGMDTEHIKREIDFLVPLILGVIALPIHGMFASAGLEVTPAIIQILITEVVYFLYLHLYLARPHAEGVSANPVHWRLAFLSALENDAKKEKNPKRNIWTRARASWSGRSLEDKIGVDYLVRYIATYLDNNQPNGDERVRTECQKQLMMAEFINNPILLFAWIGRFGRYSRQSANRASMAIGQFGQQFPSLNTQTKKWIDEPIKWVDTDGDVVEGKDTGAAAALIDEMDLVGMAELVLHRCQIDPLFKTEMESRMRTADIFRPFVAVRTSLRSPTQPQPLMTAMLGVKQPATKEETQAWKIDQGEVTCEFERAKDKIRHTTQQQRLAEKDTKPFSGKNLNDQIAFEAYLFVLQYGQLLSDEQRQDLFADIVKTDADTRDGDLYGWSLPSPVLKVVKLLMEPKYYGEDRDLGEQATRFYYGYLKRSFQTRMMRYDWYDEGDIKKYFEDLAKRAKKLASKPDLSIKDTEFVEFMSLLRSITESLESFYSSYKDSLRSAAYSASKGEVESVGHGVVDSNIKALLKIRAIITSMDTQLITPFFNPRIDEASSSDGTAVTASVVLRPTGALSSVLSHAVINNEAGEMFRKIDDIGKRPIINVGELYQVIGASLLGAQNSLQQLVLLAQRIEQEIGQSAMNGVQVPQGVTQVRSVT